MEFVKYCSIENHYQEKTINAWCKLYPELYNEEYIIQEKIHGSNFSIWFEKNADDVSIKFGKRNSFLEETDSFFNWQQVVERENIKLVISRIKEYLKNSNCTNITLFGELYGEGIQKGVYYSSIKNIVFFDIKVDGLYMSPKFMEELFDKLELKNMLVPKISVIKGLDNALKIDTCFNSKLADIDFIEGNNICEGVVIKPYNKVYYYVALFYIKKKNDKFKEVQRAPKVKDERSSSALELREIFKGYINKNRLDNIFSKYGKIQELKDVGKYISLTTEDAKKDFFKDYLDEFASLNNKDKKFVVSVVPDLAKDIIKEINNECVGRIK